MRELVARLRYVELNIVPNISCVANLGLVDIQVEPWAGPNQSSTPQIHN